MTGSISTNFLASILVLFAVTPYMSVAEIAASKTSTEFIQTSCNTTTYPNLCITLLSTHASNIQTSPKLLAQTALSITLDTTNSTSTIMSELSQTRGMKPKEVAAMLDCIEALSDSVEALRESLEEMSDPGERDFGLMMNDVQTWVSAALTDEDTCPDRFAGDGKMKKVVRGRIVNIARLKSNALALINNYASLSGSQEVTIVLAKQWSSPNQLVRVRSMY